VTVPLLGPLPFSGFAHAWFLLFLLVIAVVIGLYVVITRRRRKNVLRFANMELLESVAPNRTKNTWRHVPAILLVIALVVLTTAMAAPTDDIRIPRNRAVVMLVIDVSESMVATDVAPNRLAAAQEAGRQFTDELTPGINLGLVSFGGTATILVSPTTDRGEMKAAIGTLHAQERTATGEGIFTALQAISTLGAVMGGGDAPPPARIVLESDGAETVPTNPSAPRGAFTAAQAAKDQGVEISTISFGTPQGTVELNGITEPVPVDDQTLKTITDLTGGEAFHAGTLEELQRVYGTLQQEIGFETTRGDASEGWTRLGALALTLAVLAGVLVNRRIPR
jgi:Ca-activated chloride channel family protein